MTAPARFRCPPDASPPVNITLNPLFRHILRISYLFLMFCVQNASYLHENKDLRQVGGGYPLL